MTHHLYQVGELYHPDRTVWPERTEYSFNGHHIIRGFWPHITPSELTMVKSGDIRYTLSVSNDIIFVNFKIGGMGWYNLPFSIFAVDAAERVIPSLAEIKQTENERLHLSHTIFLVEAQTGIVQVIRVLTWSPEFSAALLKAIAAQATKPALETLYTDAYVSDIYRTYPPEALACHPLLQIAACWGGE